MTTASVFGLSYKDAAVAEFCKRVNTELLMWTKKIKRR